MSGKHLASETIKIVLSSMGFEIRLLFIYRFISVHIFMDSKSALISAFQLAMQKSRLTNQIMESSGVFVTTYFQILDVAKIKVSRLLSKWYLHGNLQRSFGLHKPCDSTFQFNNSAYPVI